MKIVLLGIWLLLIHVDGRKIVSVHEHTHSRDHFLVQFHDILTFFFLQDITSKFPE